MLIVGSVCFGVVVGWLRAAAGVRQWLTSLLLVVVTVADAVLVAGVEAAAPAGFGVLAGWTGWLGFRRFVAMRAMAVRGVDELA